MASTVTLAHRENQILEERNSHVKLVILDRPEKLNALNTHMVFQLLKALKKAETDPTIKLVIVKGKGSVFCVGGDVTSTYSYVVAGHWTFATQVYAKELIINYVVATYKKPLVFLINGLVMGAGAGLSMFGRFKVVTEKVVFAMPEAALGLFPDVRASYFLSNLPRFFGEYLGLTGARLDGSEMLACGLVTHFVHSKNLPLLEDALSKVDIADLTKICKVINGHEERVPLKKNSAYQRLDIINRCFSRESVEEILSCLEYEAIDTKEEWIDAAIKSIKTATPISLKLFLRSIREGRMEDVDECLVRVHRMVSHHLRKTVSNDFYEGVRSKMFDKGSRPKWEPSKLELVSNDLLDKYYTKVDEDDGWEELQLPCRSNPQNALISKL